MNRLEQKRARARRASNATFVDDDGYVIVTAKQRRRRLSVVSISILIIGFFALKGAMIAQIGEEQFDAKVDVLCNGGTFVHHLSAFTLKSDPVSLLFAQSLQHFL